MKTTLRCLLMMFLLVSLWGLTGCSQTRTYYGYFTKDVIGGTIPAYLQIRDDDTATIHFAGEQQEVKGEITHQDDRLRIVFPDPNEPQQYLELDIVEKDVDNGKVVEGRFHWDFGGKMGIDGKVFMEQYRGN